MDNDTAIKVRMPKAQRDRLRELADEHGRTLSDHIRIALADHIERTNW